MNESAAEQGGPRIDAKPELTRHFGNVKEEKLDPITGEGVTVENKRYGRFFRGGRLDVVHVTPDQRDKNANDVVFISGLFTNASPNGTRAFAEYLARETGAEVFMPVHRGYHRWERGMQPHPFQPPEGADMPDVPSIDVEREAFLSWFMKQEGIAEKGDIDLIVQSSGVGPGALLKAEFGDKIDKFAIEQGAMHEPMGAIRGLNKFLRMSAAESFKTYFKSKESHPFMGRINKATMAAVFTHLRRVTKEIQGIAASDYGPVIADIQTADSSKMLVEAADKDPLFGDPAGGVAAKKIEGRHGELGYYPKRTAQRVAAFLKRPADTSATPAAASSV